MSTELNIYDIIIQLIKVYPSIDNMEKSGFIRHLKPIDDLAIEEPLPSENTLISIRYTQDEEINPITTTITNEILFQYCIEIPGEEFIRRFNKTIYDYIREQMNEARERNVPAVDNIWMQPNAAFVKWFQEKGIAIDSIESFIGSDDTQNEDDKYKRLEKDYESVNNQLNVANKKVVKYKRQARYRTGQIIDKELEKMADSVRFKSSKLINFDKLG